MSSLSNSKKSSVTIDTIEDKLERLRNSYMFLEHSASLAAKSGDTFRLSVAIDRLEDCKHKIHVLECSSK